MGAASFNGWAEASDAAGDLKQLILLYGWRAVVAHRDEIHHKAMNLVRHFEHMVVGNPTFSRVAVEQRWPCRAANDQREFPSDIGRVHERRIETLAAERTRQVSGVAQQEAPPVAQALSGSLMHFEIRNPLEIVQADVDADAGIEQRS